MAEGAQSRPIAPGEPAFIRRLPEGVDYTHIKAVFMDLPSLIDIIRFELPHLARKLTIRGSPQPSSGTLDGKIPAENPVGGNGRNSNFAFVGNLMVCFVGDEHEAPTARQ